jgi:hypothetical protein
MVHFSGFGITNQEKSGNPDARYYVVLSTAKLKTAKMSTDFLSTQKLSARHFADVSKGNPTYPKETLAVGLLRERIYRINHIKTGKIYQITRNIPNYHKIYQMGIHYLGIPNGRKQTNCLKIYQQLPLQDPPI